MSVQKEAWGSRIGLILAMAGSAVGFGNFLRFPVQAIQNGGGAFIIPYIICFLLLGIPLLYIEWSTGRFGGRYNMHSTPFILDSMQKGKIWKYAGVFGIFSNLIIEAYYCYIESWTLSYVYFSLGGIFRGMDQSQVAEFFTNYLSLNFSTTGIPFESVFFFLICLILNVWILSKGLSKGIEKVAKLGVPLLIIFGIFLAIKGIMIKQGHNGAVSDGIAGLNFLWTPHFDSLKNPKVWLAAAGQIFFTLSVGMGCVQCYASYIKKNDDIALNSMSAGWLNEFVEIVIGGSVIIPISIGFLGVDKVVELSQTGGFGLGFRTMPYLFQQWGPVMSAIAGLSFFGLLFIAGITSSLSMGTPVMGFFQDEFKWNRKKSSVIFGVITLILALPTILFFEQGVFDEYDYWAGTVSLVVFALFETVLFSWFFGMKRGWYEINYAADIKVPNIYKFIIKFITPSILIIVFIGALIRPANDDWTDFNHGWKLHNESIIGQIIHKGIGPNNSYFNNEFYAEQNGVVDSIYNYHNQNIIKISYLSDKNKKENALYKYKNHNVLNVKIGDKVKYGDVLYSGKVVNNIFYIDMSRLLLLLIFLGVIFMIYNAYRKNKSERSYL
ncbi:MAG: sodium-dependent transporter [Bacteroidales bacterium]|nr:sodium-dependent transporter [Bacteroidales bacterium]